MQLVRFSKGIAALKMKAINEQSRFEYNNGERT